MTMKNSTVLTNSDLINRFVLFCSFILDTVPPAKEQAKLSPVWLICQWKKPGCVSIAIMSPLTAKGKCPHHGRQSEFETEAAEKVVFSSNGIGGASLLERGKSTDAG